MKANIILINIFILVCTGLSAQQAGDYRSIATGNWTNVGIWETYTGFGWVGATNYPGESTGTNDVYIINGSTVSISSSIANSVNSVIVGDGIGAVDNFHVSGTSSINTQSFTIENGGSVEWVSNVSLSLPSGASFRIIEGGVLVSDNPCSAAKKLIIGTTTYSTCNGSGDGQYSFQEIEEEGGTLAVSPTSNSPICEGAQLNLYANPSGTGSSGASYSWTGPNGYSSTSEDPIISGLNQGVFSYTVTITDTLGNTNTKSLSVTVLPTPVISSTTPGSRIGPGTVTLNAVTPSGVLNWFSSSSGGASLGAGPSFTTPFINTTTFFYVEASDNGCVSARTPVLATINPIPSAITNSRITYRVKTN